VAADLIIAFGGRLMKVTNHKLVGSDNRQVPFVSSPNGGGPLNGGKPRFLVIHYTAGGSASGAVSWFKNPASNVSAHLVIDHDGAITQMVPFDKVGFHAGQSSWKGVNGLNRHSVGIEIANWGKLVKAGSGGWLSPVGNKPIPAERVVLAQHKNFPGQTHGWEAFDEAQFLATVEAAAAICAEYGIGPSDLVGHDDIAPSRKVDPGPAFDMDKFRALVFGRSEEDADDLLFSVRSDSGLNMRKGPGVTFDKVKLLADGAVVHVIDKSGTWWLVAEQVNGHDDDTGYVHSHWLRPV
jgi:N-acetylmuramoyl-L-alanine amidase